ncbi:MAG: right-handed parallel beta-helix repeat-containing protein [Ardenticatenales bacterium]
MPTIPRTPTSAGTPTILPGTPTIPGTSDGSPLYLPLVYNGMALSPPTVTRTRPPATPVPPTWTPQPAMPTRTVQPEPATPTQTTQPGTPPPATPTQAVVAADLFVDDDNTSGVENGSALRPYRTVQQAIDAASGGNVIAVAGGAYSEALRVQDKTVSLYGGYVGGTVADYAGGAGGNFGDRNPTANAANLQGNFQDSVVTLIESGSTILDGFRITRGARTAALLPLCLGGGLYVDGGEPSISNNIIEGNSTCPDAANGEELRGGGIYATNANISIQDNVIRDNVSGRGAGIAINGGAKVVIRRNTIQDNIGRGDHGGGVYVFATDAEISHNRIAGNEIGRELGYGWGGGMALFNEGSLTRLSYNVFTDNFAPSLGSAILIDNGARADMDHELFYANQCGVSSGVPGGVSTVFVDGDASGIGSSLTMSNSTIAGHDCDPPVAGNAVTVQEFSDVVIRNSIFWGNGGDDVDVDGTSKLKVTYTLSEEILSGIGNLSTDPLFADLAGNDHHLRSTAGRWDPTANGGTGAWVLDGQDSPAIDAADPASPFAAEPDPNGGRADMGVYGDTPQASKSRPR